MRKLLLAAVIALTAGCTATIDAMLTQVGAEPGTVTRIEDKTIGTVAKPIPVYCNAPGIVREQFRAKINAHPAMAGNQIAVWCVGDPPVTLGQ